MISRKLFAVVFGIFLFIAGAGAQDLIGEPAPDFTLTDQNGNEHSLSDYQGKVLLINFILHS